MSEWIEWVGRPTDRETYNVVFPDLDMDTLVDVRFRDGLDDGTGEPYDTVLNWKPCWGNDGHNSEIIAYRVIDQREAK